MDAALKEASSQLIRRKYASQPAYEDYTTRLQYGMAFHKKPADRKKERKNGMTTETIPGRE